MSPGEFKALECGDVLCWGDTVARVTTEFHNGCVGIEYPTGTEEPLHISECFGVDKQGEGDTK